MHKYVRDCRKTFSNNKFVIKHVNTDKQIHDIIVIDKNAQLSLWKQFVIIFIVISNKNDEYEFKNWKYVIVKITIVYQKIMKDLCLNIDCIMSLIDRQWLHVLIFDIVIKQIVDLMTIREIEDREHFNFDYVNVNLYLKDKLKKKTFIVHIKRDVHVVDNLRVKMLIDTNNLRVKMLIDTNIMCSEKMIVNLQIRKFIIDNCNMTTSIICTFIDLKINRIVKFHHVVTISTHIVVTMSFKQNVNLSIERDYSFQSHVISINFETKDDNMTHIVDFKTSMIHVRNVIDKTIIVSKHTKFDKIFDFDEKDCYHVDVVDVHLCHESCLSQYVAKTRIFDLKSKYVHEDRMSKVEVCVKLTLIFTWTFVDKIKFNRSFFQDMLVTLSFSLLQVSSRNDYLISSDRSTLRRNSLTEA